MTQTKGATITFDQSAGILQLTGLWSLPGLERVQEEIAHIPQTHLNTVQISGAKITAMDSAGAWIIWQITQTFEHSGQKFQLTGFSDEHQSLLHLVQNESKKLQAPAEQPLPQLSWVHKIGKATVTLYVELLEFIAFIGEVVVMFSKSFRQPLKLQWSGFLNTIYDTGFQALLIIGLLNFLIGIVLTYQMGQQLKIYGANIYIVSLIGVGILQEFAPLITAIIVAGRTSSAFTAQLGIMKINEELDALKTMGLSPVDLLVLPKIIGLTVALPLLVIWGDVFGLLGGMVVSKQMLSISFYDFVLRFPLVVNVSTFLKGLLKAPFFAVIIASIGCFQGFKVSSTADSVGWQTTKSVVQAIFLIIVADALFSIILPWQSV